jgi:uncharacterized protein YndB with AHSA1/START domain
MTRSERTFTAPPEAVYAVLVDAERYPRWLVGARQVRVDDPAWPQPGSSFAHHVGAGPVDVEDATTVAVNEPGRRLDLVVRARPFLEADVSFRVEPHGAGTRLVMEEIPRGRFRLLAPFLAPLVKLRNDRSLCRLVEVVDGPATT